MQTEVFSVQNIKCAGCSNTIQQNLSALPGVSRVEVKFPGGPVTVYGDDVQRDAVAKKLAEIGYPVTAP